MAEHLLALRVSNAYLLKDFASEFFRRQPLLAGYAAIALSMGMLCLAGTVIDPRRIGDVSVWLKPTKFFISIGVFVATTAWFFGYIRPERRSSWLACAIIVLLLGSATFELAWITWQGARGEASHFNFSTPFTRQMYALMGVAAVLLTATTLPLAWEIGRRPIVALEPGYRLAIILGLVLTFLLGGTAGGLISQNGSAAVGDHASAIPLLQWNQIGGDLRIAHFLGIHAQQAIPLCGWIIGLADVRRPRLAVALAASAYSLLTAAALLHAYAGRPLLG